MLLFITDGPIRSVAAHFTTFSYPFWRATRLANTNDDGIVGGAGRLESYTRLPVLTLMGS